MHVSSARDLAALGPCPRIRHTLALVLSRGSFLVRTASNLSLVSALMSASTTRVVTLTRTRADLATEIEDELYAQGRQFVTGAVSTEG